jgi:hypothetical protein
MIQKGNIKHVFPFTLSARDFIMLTKKELTKNLEGFIEE